MPSLLTVLFLVIAHRVLWIALVLVGLIPLAAVRLVAHRWLFVRSLLIATGVTSVALLMPMALSMARHDRAARALERSVCALEAPPDSRVLSCHGRVGLESNGNHCDYTVDLVVQTSLSRSALEDYYVRAVDKRNPALPVGYDQLSIYAGEDVFRRPPPEGAENVEVQWPGGPGSVESDWRCI